MSYSVSVTGTWGERNRLRTAQPAQEGYAIVIERAGCSAKGSKQGIDLLLPHYKCNHGFLHASFQGMIKLLYQFTVLVYEAVIQSKPLFTSLKLWNLGGNKSLPKVTSWRIKTFAFFCLSWLCDAFSWDCKSGLL